MEILSIRLCSSDRSIHIKLKHLVQMSYEFIGHKEEICEACSLFSEAGKIDRRHMGGDWRPLLSVRAAAILNRRFWPGLQHRGFEIFQRLSAYRTLRMSYAAMT